MARTAAGQLSDIYTHTERDRVEIIVDAVGVTELHIQVAVGAGVYPAGIAVVTGNRSSAGGLSIVLEDSAMGSVRVTAGLLLHQLTENGLLARGENVVGGDAHTEKLPHIEVGTCLKVCVESQ